MNGVILMTIGLLASPDTTTPQKHKHRMALVSLRPTERWGVGGNRGYFPGGPMRLLFS